MCRPGLAGPGDVVELAFNGKEGGPLNILWAYKLATDLPVSAGQGMLLKNNTDGV